MMFYGTHIAETIIRFTKRKLLTQTKKERGTKVRNVKRLFVSVVAVAMMATFIIGITGCSQDSPMSPVTKNQSNSSGRVVQSDIGPVTILQLSQTHRESESLSKVAGTYSSEKFIKAVEGGVVTVGNNDLGYSKIVVDPNDLPEDMTISLQWASDGYCEGEFGPHGTQFNDPVKVVLSYKGADLSDIDEDDLKISYYNEDTGIWEVMGGTVDTENKEVVVYLEHFSRYAITKT